MPRTGPPRYWPMPDGWLNGRQSCFILDCSLSALFRAVIYGHIRYELDPGKPPRFLRTDVEKYALVKDKHHPAQEKTANRGSLGRLPIDGSNIPRAPVKGP